MSKQSKIPPVTDEEWLEVCDFNRDLTEEYLLESVNLSKETLKQYESGLKIWFRWVKDNVKNKPLTEIKSRDFLKYQNFLTRNGLSSSAIRFKRSCVSALNEWVITYYEDEYPTFRNFITKQIKLPPKTFVHDKEPLTEEELNILIKNLEERKEWQKLAYLTFSYSTGCRRTEATQLLKEVADYDIVRKEKEIANDNGEKEIKEIKYYITHEIRCKGRGEVGKVRKLKFDETAMKYIKKWLEVRGEDDCPYVFVTKYGGEIKQISRNTFNQWCSNDFEKCIGRRVHPHILRESRATNLVIHEGKNIEAAQSLLGHESSETTQIYVIRDTSEDADEAFL
ncbi:tyrosine-type recombinase/integrase [Clostridium sporogenes]|uniref:tyrosine-type recombinase/integrase n=1 Tax=Clostridium sporogenes TaxID=1509 RepID=UPI0013D10584|nr:tyrosine-type recombinase/integrase [Clostridium sporogenes]NFF75988.1 hypothetical protein [Clostridium sporogenes]NFH40886.1 hypothetical protein [Clostridium sporogenes]